MIRYPSPFLAAKNSPMIKTQADIDLHIADDRGNGAWQDHFGQCVVSRSVECVNELDLFFIDCCETGVQI